MPGETAAKLRRQVSRNRTRTGRPPRPHPQRRPDLRRRPLRQQRAPTVRATAIAPKPIASFRVRSAWKWIAWRRAWRSAAQMTRIVASYDGVHCSASSRSRRSRRTSHGRTTDSPPLSPVRLFLSDDRTAIHLVSHDESDFGIGASGSRLDLLIRYELMRSKPGVKHDEDLLP
jgi:hypothetical protein